MISFITFCLLTRFSSNAQAQSIWYIIVPTQHYAHVISINSPYCFEDKAIDICDCFISTEIEPPSLGRTKLTGITKSVCMRRGFFARSPVEVDVANTPLCVNIPCLLRIIKGEIEAFLIMLSSLWCNSISYAEHSCVCEFQNCT